MVGEEGIGRVWLGEGEARFRPARGGVEGLVVGVAASSDRACAGGVVCEPVDDVPSTVRSQYYGL